MATQYYVSITRDPSNLAQDSTNLNSGTASTSTDSFEFRMGNGTYLPNREQCLHALEMFHRWIMQGGLNQAGASLPLPATGTEP
jgi:hypothetical protein